MNRRNRRRAAFSTTVRFFVSGREILASDSKDLSLNGVYLFTAARPALGTRGEVEIVLSLGGSQIFLPIQGRVTRQDETGLALQFEKMDQPVFFHLKKLLEYNTGNPDELEAELIRYPFNPRSRARPV